jgi:hypothetical protein
MRFSLVLALVTVLAWPAVGFAGTQHRYVTEEAAVQAIRKKLVVPCDAIRNRADCSSTEARKELARNEAAAARCQKEPLPQDRLSCITSLARLTRDATQNLNHVLHGFRPRKVSCVAGSDPDASGYRFWRFRCKLVFRDEVSAWRIVDVRMNILIWTTRPSGWHYKSY